MGFNLSRCSVYCIIAYTSDGFYNVQMIGIVITKLSMGYNLEDYTNTSKHNEIIVYRSEINFL